MLATDTAIAYPRPYHTAIGRTANTYSTPRLRTGATCFKPKIATVTIVTAATLTAARTRKGGAFTTQVYHRLLGHVQPRSLRLRACDHWRMSSHPQPLALVYRRGTDRRTATRWWLIGLVVST